MPSPHFSVDWFKRHIPVWQEVFAEMTGRPGLRGVEVGCLEGRSACWLLQHVLTHPTSHLICVDTFCGSEEHTDLPERTLTNMETIFDNNIDAINAQSRVQKCVGLSSVVLRTLELQSFDFVHIDGSHYAIDVLIDGVLSWDLLRPNGLLIFDDYRWSDRTEEYARPRSAIDAFLAVFEGTYRMVHRDKQVILRKESGRHPCAVKQNAAWELLQDAATFKDRSPRLRPS